MNLIAEASVQTDGRDRASPTQTKPSAGAGPRHPVAVIFFWLLGSFFILAGLIAAISAGPWKNDLVLGVIVAIGGLYLTPPGTQALRKRYRFWRPRWVPAAFAVTLPIVAATVSLPFKPSAAEQDQLKVSAMLSANEALAAGKPDEADKALAKFRSRRATDPALDTLFSKIDLKKAGHLAPSVAAVQSTAPDPTKNALDEPIQSPEANFAERIQTYWLPAVAALPATPPEDMEALQKRLSDLETLVIDLQDGDGLNLSKAQRGMRAKYVAALAAKQAKLFPVLRRAYGKLTDARLFRHDVRAVVSGPQAQTIRLTGAMFSLNANIEDVEAGVMPTLHKIRFRRIEFRWSHYFNDGSHYDLKSPSDRAVGLTDSSGGFTKIG